MMMMMMMMMIDNDEDLVMLFICIYFGDRSVYFSSQKTVTD
jgi:hypothetical protein